MILRNSDPPGGSQPTRGFHRAFFLLSGWDFSGIPLLQYSDGVRFIPIPGAWAALPPAGLMTGSRVAGAVRSPGNGSRDHGTGDGFQTGMEENACVPCNLPGLPLRNVRMAASDEVCILRDREGPHHHRKGRFPARLEPPPVPPDPIQKGKFPHLSAWKTRPSPLLSLYLPPLGARSGAACR